MMNDKEITRISKNIYCLCSNCGNFILYSEKEKFCNVCGEALLKKCPNCLEHIIYPLSKFCPVCGTRLINKKAE